MTDAPPFAPAIKQFFDKALPVDRGIHTLVLGEAHHKTEHVDFLSQHIDQLQQDHRVDTLGIEMQSYVNVVLWAYQDGTLEQQLGPNLSRLYLGHIFAAVSKEEFRDHASSSATLAMLAMDRDIQPVAYDSRQTFAEHFKQSYELFRGADSEEAFHARQQNIRTSAERLNQISTSEDRHSWALHEVDWLMRLHPEYKERLAAIDHAIEVGHQKIRQGKLSGDGLSACLFDALAGPGNRLVIAGARHMGGAGHPPTTKKPQNHPAHIDGTLSYHLSALCQSGDMVTNAWMGTTKFLDDLRNDVKDDLANPRRKMIFGTPLSAVNIETNTVTDFSPLPPTEEMAQSVHAVGFHGLAGYMDASANEAKVVTLADKFMPLYKGTPSEKAEHTKRHVNPLLMPDIKRAMDAVHSAACQLDRRFER